MWKTRKTLALSGTEPVNWCETLTPLNSQKQVKLLSVRKNDLELAVNPVATLPGLERFGLGIG
jgi:hypothetical protein